MAVEVCIATGPFTAFVAISTFFASGAEIFNLARGSGFLRTMSIAAGAIKSSIINPGPKSIDFIGLIEKGVRSKAGEAATPATLTVGQMYKAGRLKAMAIPFAFLDAVEEPIGVIMIPPAEVRLGIL